VVNHRRDGEDAAKPFVQTLLGHVRHGEQALHHTGSGDFLRESKGAPYRSR